MSDNKLLNENTVRRFMKLANVDTLTNNFIQEKFANNEEKLNEQDVPEMEEAEPIEDEPVEPAEESPEEMEMEMGDEEPEMEMGAADISLTEEEAELLIDLGERLKEAMDMDVEDDMEVEDDIGDEEEIDEEPMGDEIEEPMGEPEDLEEPAGYRVSMQENKDQIVREVLKRVTKRILNNRR